MKKIINSLLLFVLAAGVLQGCKDDVDYSSHGGAVSKLVLPEDNTHLDLMKSPHTMIRFQWDAPNSEYSYLYKIAFYNSTSGSAFYQTESDDAGTSNTFTISQEELGRIAGIGGIDQRDTGDIYWNVIASNGVTESQPTAARRKITIGRYAGIQDVPVSLYLYGEAGEGGTNYSALPKFKFIDDGVFEIFTYLEGGKKFNITNRKVPENSRNFWIDDEGLLWEGDNSDMGFAPDNDGIYRITLNFPDAEATFEEVTLMEYWYCNDRTRNRPLDYIGYGKWKSDEFQLDFSDNRYAFNSVIGGTQIRWGYIYDNSEIVPDMLTGSYFNVFAYPAPWKDAWEYSFKFNSELNGNDITLYLDLSSDQDYYFHSIDILSTDPDPVMVLNAPADGHLADIRAMGASGTLTFDWDAVDGPSSVPERYELLFFADEELNSQIILQESGGMNDEIQFIPGNGGLDTDFTLTSEELQAIADFVEANEDGDKVVYWTVRSRIMGYRTTGAVRKLVIRPVSLPTSLVLTGNSTEFGNGRYEFRMMGTASQGLFEAYCQFTGGSDYQFIDNFNREWVISGNTIDLGTGGNPSLNGLYVINFNFFNETVTVEQITNPRFHVPAAERSYSFTYTGNGVWEINETVIRWVTDWWGHGDDRCRVLMDLNGTVTKFASDWEDFANDGDYNTNLPEGTDPNYYVYRTGEMDDWKFDWKIWYGSGYRNTENKRMNIKLNMNTTVDYYYIFFEYLDM